MTLESVHSIQRTMVIGIAFSVLVHLVPLVFSKKYSPEAPTKLNKVSVQIKETPEPAPPPPLEMKPPEPIPPKPKLPDKPKPAPAKPAPSNTGLSQESVLPQGQGAFKTNLGDTLSEAPPEKRTEFLPSGTGSGDKSRDAILLPESVPQVQYTDEALDAGFEAKIVADVFVETDGSVSSVELRKKVGYGMDPRLTKAAYNAKFKPRLNSQGIPERGWATITFNLVIP